MIEFKLQYYFQRYKDTCVISASKFREVFIKKEGNFELINELLIMIQKYQQQKYGDLIASGKETIRIVKKGSYNKIENQRNNNRFGTVEERKRRKLEEKWK